MTQRKLSQNFKPGSSLIHAVSFNKNLPWRLFQQEPLWGCEKLIRDRWTWNQMWILCSQIITRINLEKFCHNLNDKLISAIKTFDDLVLEANLQSFTKYLRLTLVFMWNNPLRQKFNFNFNFNFKILIFNFSSFLLVLTKFSFWPEHCSRGYQSIKFGHFPDIS